MNPQCKQAGKTIGRKTFARYIVGAAAIIVVSGSFLYTNFVPRVAGIIISSGFHDQSRQNFGWPAIYYIRSVSTPTSSFPPPHDKPTIHTQYFSLFRLTVNIIALILAISSTWFVSGRPFESRRLFQFRIATLMSLMAVCAVLCKILLYEWPDDSKWIVLFISGSDFYYPITQYPVWIYVPVLCGVACSVFILCELLLFCLGITLKHGLRLFKTRLFNPPPEKQV